MDNEKIGNLIADLRKKQGLTQQELGDKVGVGFRAVSKWERGITLPDITIINELSKILGISSDELLTGELKKKEDKEIKNEPKKKNQRILITASIIAAIIIIFTVLFIYNNNNKTYTYNMLSTEENDYYIDGKVIFNQDNISITTNKIYFRDLNFAETIIRNYEYSLITEDEVIFGYGFIDSIQLVDSPVSIKELLKTITISFDGKTKLPKETITKNNLKLTFKFLDEENNEITKEIIIKLKQAK